MILRKLLTASALTMTLAATAVLPTKTSQNGTIYICPKEYGLDGKPSFFFCSGEDSAVIFEQINENIETVETFSLPVKTYRQESKILIPSGYIKAYRYEESANYAAGSMTEAITIVKQYFPSGFTTVNVTSSSDYEREQTLFYEGNKLPEGLKPTMTSWEIREWNELYNQFRTTSYPNYASYIPYNGVITFLNDTEYDSGDLDWSTPVTRVLSSHTYEYESEPYDYIYYTDSELTDDADLCITQTLFNSDADFEVLIPMYAESGGTTTTEVRNYAYPKSYEFDGMTKYTNDWNEEESNKVSFLGIAAVNIRTGETVATFELPEPYTMGQNRREIDNPYYYKLGEKTYLCVVVSSEDEDSICYFFAIEKGMSGAQAPVMMKKVKVHPLIVNRGTDIEVSTDDHISSITLTGINGQIEQRIAGRGADRHMLKTDRLPSGVHLVDVRTQDGGQSVSKIIVK